MRQSHSVGKRRITKHANKSPGIRPAGGFYQRPLRYEMLEDRLLLSITWQQTLQAYDGDAKTLVQQSASIAGQALGINIPLLSDKLSSVLGIAKDFQTPFNTQPVETAWNNVVSDFQNAGFTILAGSIDNNGNLIPDANGNLLEVSRTYSVAAPAALIASGKTGFDYLDNAGGGLFGALNVQSPSISLQATLGIDLQNGNPTFFVADSTGLQLHNLTASGSLGGNLAIGSLANVDASVTPSLTISTASLTLHSIEGDHKIRAADFTNSLPQVVVGSVSGSVTLGANLTAHMSMLPDISWSPSFTATIDNSGFHQGSFNLNPPSAQSLLSGLMPNFFSLGDGIPLLGPLSGALNQPLPLIHESIAQLTGIDGYLPNLPNPGNLGIGGLGLPQLSSLLGSLEADIPGLQFNSGHINPDDLSNMAVSLIQGTYTNTIVQWTASGSVPLVNFSTTIPILGIGIPDIASAEIDATFGVNASLTYDVGLGIDGNGFWIKAGSSADPLLGLKFGANAGLEGQVEVFGFPLANAGGNVGFQIEPDVFLTAPPYSANPGHVYAKDLAIFGSNPVNDVLDALSYGIQGDMTGNIYAGIHLLFFSIGWNWGIDIPVFNYVHNATWPAAPGSGTASSDPWSGYVVQNAPGYPAGSLVFNGPTIDGNPSNDYVNLSGGTNGSVTLNWAGWGQPRTYTGVSEVFFNGNGGNDRLTTSPGFNIPIYATESGSSGNNFLQGGDAGNTLIAGSGNDTLIGGAGNDSITGGAGQDLIIGNDGNDTLTAGSGATQIFGGSGNSTLIGGSGNDSLYGGGGNDVIHGGSGVYFIDAGGGNCVIYGDAGHAAETINGMLTYPVIHGGSGDNLIYGGTAPTQIFGDGGSDTIYGGPGSDTIYGGSGGNNLIHGGGGNDLILGGGSGDILCGDSGNATIYGGPGSETLYGGDGLDLQTNGAGGLFSPAGDSLSLGSNMLIGGSGNDAIYGDSTGHNTLQAGAGNDTLYAGTAGDYLAAGPGVDALYGGPGNDSLQLAFSPTGQQPDTVVGGAGLDTLVLKGGAVAGALAAPITDTTSTTISVADGTLNCIKPPSGTPFVIQIDSELMSVTVVSGNTLTVTRGYNGTTATPHGNNSVVLPSPGPSDFKLYFTQTPGVANQYQAMLYNLDWLNQNPNAASLGSVTFTMPADVEQVALEGGPGNNLIQVDRSVNRDMFLYGGPGNNTLIGGSGNDTLVGGSGNSVLWGGPGDSILYGGDMPSQDSTPQLDSSGTVTTHSEAPGHATLIAGSGNDELYAGDGGDVLIGGSAVLQNGQFVLVPGAGRDYLKGGAGNDLLISGPGSPGAIMIAGSGNDTLVADNFGVNYLQGRGSAGTQSLLVGGSLVNVIDDSYSSGADTLVAGGNPAQWAAVQNAALARNVSLLPPSNLVPWDPVVEGNIQYYLAKQQQQGGLDLSDYQALAKLLQQVFDEVSAREQAVKQQIDAVLTREQTPGITANEMAQLVAQQNFLATQDSTLNEEKLYVDKELGAKNSLVDSLIGGSGDDTFYGSPTGTWLSGGSATSAFSNYFYNYNASDTIMGDLGKKDNILMFQGDGAINLQHVVSNGQDAVSVTIPTLNGGQPFVVGNVGNISGIQAIGVQTLAGNDTVTVNFGLWAGMNVYVRCGSGNDVIDASTLQAQATLLGGTGNDTIKIGAQFATGSVYNGGAGQSELDIQGSNNGDQVIVTGGGLTVDGLPVNRRTGTTTSGSNVITGLASASLLTIGQTVTGGGLPNGTTIVSIDPNTNNLTVSNPASGPGVGVGVTLTFGIAFQKIVVIGGSGTNTFTTDGSIPNVILQGGSGTNTLSVAGGTAEVIGGAGSNSFTLNGPGNYTVLGGSGVNSINTLVVNCDNNGETVKLVQNGSASSTIVMSGGSSAGTLTGTATNISSVSVFGGTGNDTLNASGMIMPITLDGAPPVVVNGVMTHARGGGSGSGTDMLIGGAGDDVLYYGPNTSYDGGGGTNNQIIYQATPGDTVCILTRSFEVNSQIDTLGGSVSNIESYQVAGAPIAGYGDDFTLGTQLWYHGFLDNQAGVPDGTADYITTDTGGPSGNYMEIGEYVDNQDGGVEQTAGFIFQGLTYNPQTQGAITSIRYDFLDNNLVGNQTHAGTWDASQDVIIAPAVVQDGSIFSPWPEDNLDVGTRAPGWTHDSVVVNQASPWGWFFDGAVPNLTNGDPIQFGLVIQTLESPDIQRSGLGFDNFSVSISNATGTLPARPGLNSPVTSTGITIGNTAGTPVTSLNGGFTDPNPNASTSTDTAMINWGDGTTSSGTVASTGGGNFTITGSHIYVNSGTQPTGTPISATYPVLTYPVTASIVDSMGAATAATQSYTGGLQLESNGDLRNYTSTNYTLLDSGVASFVVRSADSTVFTLHTPANGDLFANNGSGSPSRIEGGVAKIFLGPDNKIYDWHGPGGNLYSINLYSPGLGWTETFAQSNVQALTQDNSGTVYAQLGGSLYDMPTAASGWVLVRQNVTSLTADASGAGVDVMGADGNYWLFNGAAATWTLLAGPHFSFSVPSSATAGQAASLTVAVLNYFGSPVSAYLDTVHFTSTDVAAGLPADYTFTSSDAGTHTFSNLTTFRTAGSQTINVTDTTNWLPAWVAAFPASAGSQTVNVSNTTTNATASGSITISPAAVSFLNVATITSPVVVGNPATISVTAEDQYGNVVRGYVGTVHFSITSTDSQAMLPTNYPFTAGDNGTHTFSVTLKTVNGQSVTATDTANSSITGSASPIVGPAAFSPLQCTITVAAANILPSGTTTVTLTARDAYGNQETSGGLTVTFGLGGGGTLNPVPPTDNGDGTYTTTFTAGATAGSTTIMAFVNSQFLTTPSPTIVVAPDTTPPTASIMAVNPSSRYAPAGSVTLAFSEPVSGLTRPSLQLALNGTNAPLTGATLTPIDNPSGTFHQYWTLGNLAGLTYAGGTYQLTLVAAGSGITDSAGNSLATGTSASWVMSTSTVQGTTAGSNIFRIACNAADPTKVDVYINNPGTTPSYTVPLSRVSQWSVTGAVGDQLVVDFYNGNPIPQYGGVSFNGIAATNNDTLSIVGTSGNDNVTMTATQITVGSAAAINYSNVSFFRFDLGGGQDSLTVNGATLRTNADNAITAGAALTVTGGGVVDLGGMTDTLGNLTLVDGSILNGTLHANSYSIQSGTVTAAIAGPGGLQKTTTAQATTGAVSTSNVSVDAGQLTATSINANTLTIGAGATITIAPLPGGPQAANSDLTPLAADALLSNQNKTDTQPTTANTIAPSPSTTTTIAAEPLAASMVLAAPVPASSEVTSALASSGSLSNTVLDAVAAPIAIVTDIALPVPLVESNPARLIDTAINRLPSQLPIYSRLDSTALNKIIESGLEQSLTTRNGNITSIPILDQLHGELTSHMEKIDKHRTTPVINNRQAHFAALQTVVQNSLWTDTDVEADFDIAQHVRAGKHSKQLEKAVDEVLAEEDAILVEI